MTAKINPKKPLPCLFVHGSFANANSWRKIIEYLPAHYNCYTVDLPGHGGTADPDDFNNPTLKPEFDTISAKLDTIPNATQGIHLIGHSYGGVVALAAAMEKIAPVKKLTLFEPVDAGVLKVFSETQAMKIINDFQEEYRQAIVESDALACAKVIDFWGGAGSFAKIPDHIQTSMATMTKNNARHWDLCVSNVREIKKYQNLNIPVTLVNGQLSHMVAKKISGALNDHLPDSNLNVIDNASHFMITSHPEECANLICK